MHQSSVRLQYTPRRFIFDDASKNFLIIESDHHVQPASKRTETDLDVELFGYPRAPDGVWASSIRVLSPFSGETLDLLELNNNEAAIRYVNCDFSLTMGIFLSHPNETLFVVGSVSNMTLTPKSYTSGFVSIYRLLEGSKLELLQKTPLDGIPYGLCPFQGKLLVGLGQTLRIYEIGKKKLLRKCETKSFPHNIIKIETQGDRIFVSDAAESAHFCLYRHYDNQIIIFADDFIPRWMTSSTLLDYDTIAGGDRFGNIFIIRLDPEISKSMDEDTTGSVAVYERGYLNGAPNKLSHMVDFHVGESITSIQKTVLAPGGKEVLMYTTILGTVGLLVPFTSKDDVEFMSLLEMTMRQHSPPLCGQNHLAYRGTYTPVSHCIDGDLCEMFNLLPNEKKRLVASGLDRTTSEVAKKLEDLRNRVAF